MPFTTNTSVAVSDPTRAFDLNSLINDLDYFSTAMTFGISLGTSTAITTTGNIVFTAPLANALSMTFSGQNILFDSPTPVTSLANTSAGSTLTGSLIMQSGANVGITISGSTFNFTATAAGGGNTQPAFYAHLGADLSVLAAVAATITYNTTTFNVGDMFVTLSSFARPSITGTYLFSSHVRANVQSSLASYLRRNTDSREKMHTNIGFGHGNYTIGFVSTTAETYFITAYNDASNWTAISGTQTTWFCGTRIGLL